MSGFAAPTIMFLNSWNKVERDFMQQLTRKLYLTGDYQVAAEPIAGGFPMCAAYAMAGFGTDQIQASADNLFSATVGTCMAMNDPAELGVHIWGEELEMTGDIFQDCGTILYELALGRMEAKPAVIYWQEIVHDLKVRREQHIDKTIYFLWQMYERIAGIDFRVETAWQHMRRLSRREDAIIIINPPSYAGAYERFMSTAGKIEWNQPDTEIWEPKRDQPKLVEESKEWDATLLVLQMAPHGECAHPEPIYAHDKRRDANDYIWTNKPDRVREVMGLTSRVRNAATPKPLPNPILPPDYEIRDDSECMIKKLKSVESRYYKDLWIHKLDFAQASGEFACFIDGFIAGIAGFNHAPLDNADQGSITLMMLYAVGPHHNQVRPTRLVKMLALDRCVLQATIFPWFVASATHIMTKNWTPHPEAKGQRGIMQLADRKPHPMYGYELTYVAEIEERTIEETFALWLRKEREWQKSRNPSTSSKGRRQRRGRTARESQPTSAS